MTAMASSRTEPSAGEGALASSEHLLVPHLAAAYNLARWITGNDLEAEDLVQEAYLRAFKSFGDFRGGDGRAWLLAIVRNTCYTWLHQNRPHKHDAVFDEEIHGREGSSSNPETLLLQSMNSKFLKQALQELPLEFREVLVMRELEGLSYNQIAAAACIPIGTVMSRLTRARRQLNKCATKGFPSGRKP